MARDMGQIRDRVPTSPTVSLLIGVPVYDSPCGDFVRSLDRLQRALDRIGLRHGYFEVRHESLIPRARNRIADFFLKRTTFSHLFQLDSDIVFEPSDVLRLLHSGFDFCAAPYPAKHLGGKLIGNVAYIGGERLVKNGFCLAQDLPTGFMLTARSVFETLRPHVPEVDDDVPGGGREPYHVYFDCGVSDRQYLSEDWWFSRLAIKGGVNGWLDMKSRLKHIGRHAFEAPPLEEQPTPKVAK